RAVQPSPPSSTQELSAPKPAVKSASPAGARLLPKPTSKLQALTKRVVKNARASAVAKIEPPAKPAVRNTPPLPEVTEAETPVSPTATKPAPSKPTITDEATANIVAKPKSTLPIEEPTAVAPVPTNTSVTRLQKVRRGTAVA